MASSGAATGRFCVTIVGVSAVGWTAAGTSAFTAATILYLLITLLVVLLMRRVETRTRIPGYIAQGQA